MKKIKIFEWKGMYPIKKMLLVIIWLVGCFLCVAGIVTFISNNDVENLLIGIFFGIGVAVLFYPIKHYVFTTYHCVPCLNSKLQKVELEELLEGEVFDKISNKEGNITNCDIKLSEHWICAKGKLLAKNLLLIGYPRVTSSLIGRATTPMVFVYMTGDIVKVDLKVDLSIEKISLLKKYFWNNLGIVSKEVVGKHAEEVTDILKKQYQILKEEMKLDDHALLIEMINEPQKYRKLYMELLPYHIKKWCEEQNEEERERLQSNGRRKKGSRK